MSAGGWVVTLVDGREEVTPAEADRFRVADGVLIFLSSRTYGPDQTVVTYVLMNVLKWRPVR